MRNDSGVLVKRRWYGENKKSDLRMRSSTESDRGGATSAGGVAGWLDFLYINSFDQGKYPGYMLKCNEEAGLTKLMRSICTLSQT